ncbi:MAG: hypothetical protein U0M20_08890, partial [Christensenellales bacterium]|nr:hypothetical protein [Christensenellales bacterium]
CTAKITPCGCVSGERTHAEKLTKRSNPFCEPPMAVIGSKPPEAIIKIRNFGRRVRPKLHLADA